jgi:hypothetical protein
MLEFYFVFDKDCRIRNDDWSLCLLESIKRINVCNHFLICSRWSEWWRDEFSQITSTILSRLKNFQFFSQSANDICRILLTDERMNCYCCLSKMNEKFSLLYKKSFSFIYLLILIFWFIEIHLRIEIFVCHEDFFFWSSHLRSSLSLWFDLIKIAYSSSNSLIFRQSRKSVNLKEIISIEWL